MSNRFVDDYNRKGSYNSSTSNSRSSRRSYSRSRSRSHSPKERNRRDRHDEYYERKHQRSSSKNNKSTYNVDSVKSQSRKSNEISSDDEFDSQPVAPPPPIISKITAEANKKDARSSSTSKPTLISKLKQSGIQMKLNPINKEPAKKLTISNAFNNDSDEEVEEMPAECRMRMRNIGRDTPTSSGPNSFGKTKQGFCDAKKIFEKNLRNTISD